MIVCNGHILGKKRHQLPEFIPNCFIGVSCENQEQFKKYHELLTAMQNDSAIENIMLGHFAELKLKLAAQGLLKGGIQQ